MAPRVPVHNTTWAVVAPPVLHRKDDCRDREAAQTHRWLVFGTSSPTHLSHRRPGVPSVLASSSPRERASTCPRARRGEASGCSRRKAPCGQGWPDVRSDSQVVEAFVPRQPVGSLTGRGRDPTLRRRRPFLRLGRTHQGLNGDRLGKKAKVGGPMYALGPSRR